jgi:hypothetical protein
MYKVIEPQLGWLRLEYIMQDNKESLDYVQFNHFKARVSRIEKGKTNINIF